MHCCPRSNKAPAAKYITVTIFQLITSELIELSFDDKKNECTCKMGFIDARPAYLNDSLWEILYILKNVTN